MTTREVQLVVRETNSTAHDMEGLLPPPDRPLSGPDFVAGAVAPLNATDREHFVVFHLSVKNRVLRYEVISVGHLTASLVHPREVFRSAILSGADSIVAAHNHPSGDPTPSVQDALVTRRLFKAGELLQIPLRDHVIVGDGGRYYSFQEHEVDPFVPGGES